MSENSTSTRARLDENFERLNANMERLSGALEEQNHRFKAEKEAETQAAPKGSRGTLATALAVVGFKLGGLIGGKIGAGKAALTSNGQIFGGPLGFTDKFFRETAFNALIGSVIGTVAGGLMGWFRGDRIKDPADLLKKPIQSLERIFGPKPVDEPAHEAAEEQVKRQAAAPQASWVDRTSQPAQQQPATQHTR